MKSIIKKILLKIPNLIKKFLYGEIIEDNKKIHEKLDKLKKDLKDNQLDVMKIAISSKEIPLSERVTIGKKYLDAGGNGAIKVQVKVLNERYEKEIKGDENVIC